MQGREVGEDMSCIVKIRVWIQTDKIGSLCEDILEFDIDDWELMTKTEQSTEIKDAAFNMCDWGFEETYLPD